MNVWILGAGRFGGMALERLLARTDGDWPRAAFTVVDPDPGALQALRERNAPDGPIARASSRVELVEADAVGFAAERLFPAAPVSGPGDDPPAWVVPALPIHLAAEVCLRRGRGLHRVPAPDPSAFRLPVAFAAASGDIGVSLSTILCPPNCPEAEGRCFMTGEPRPLALFEILAQTALPGFTPLSLRSRQLSLGVGGLPGNELVSLPDRLAGLDGPILLSTACRCHGVVTALSR